MVSHSKEFYSKRNSYQNYDARFTPLLQSMTGVQRCVQDVVLKFAKKGASVRNGELLRSMPLQFDDVAICSINSKVHYWNGRYYEPLSKEEFTKFLLRFMGNCNVQAEAYNSLPLLQEACFNVALSKKRRVDSSKVIFANGVYDVSTKTFTKGFSPNVVQINACDYDYELQEPLMWRNFLDTVLPDKASRETLQMFLGATLLPREEAKIERMLVLYGNGANGKSVVYETVRGVLGAGSVSSLGLADFTNESERGHNILFCNGKRLNYCSEIRSFLGKDIYDDALKMLISREAQTVRSKYGRESYTVSDIPMFMANTNWDLKKDCPMSAALRRRITQINFNVQIPLEMQDKALHRRLEREYAGIFLWFMEGLEMLRGNDYKFPDEEKLATPLQECAERKKIMGSTLWDIVLSYLTNNRYNFKCYGTRTSKFNMKLTSFRENIIAYATSNGILFEDGKEPTTNALADLFKGKGGVLTKSGGSRFVVLFATKEDVKAYRDTRRAAGVLESYI